MWVEIPGPLAVFARIPDYSQSDWLLLQTTRRASQIDRNVSDKIRAHDDHVSLASIRDIDKDNDALLDMSAVGSHGDGCQVPGAGSGYRWTQVLRDPSCRKMLPWKGRLLYDAHSGYSVLL